MSEQTAKIAKVRENIKSYANKRSVGGKDPMVFVHGVTLEGDPQEWEYHSLKQTCEVFVPTQEATFTTEVKVNGNFTNYKISPVRVEKKAFGGGGFSGGFKSNPEADERRQKMIIAQSSLSSAVAFYGETTGKSEEKVFEFAGKMYEWVLNKAK